MSTPAPTTGPSLRRARPEDLPAITALDGWAFHTPPDAGELAALGELADLPRWWVAELDGRLVGTAGAWAMTMTAPGGAQLAVPGVTWVAVALHARRRGVLSALMAAQLRAEAAAGSPLAVLTASEGGIYRRFGYGPATRARTVEVDRRLAAVRPGAPGEAGGVRARHASAAEAAEHAPAAFERWRTRVPGAVSRSPAWWADLLADRPGARGGGEGPLVHLVHPDGWAAYRVLDGGSRVRVTDLAAATDEAHAALWRALLALDLVDVVQSSRTPLDDPLPLLLTDGRQVRTTAVRDGSWVRLLDVPAALSARGWAVEVDVVLEVADPFLGPAAGTGSGAPAGGGAGGRYRLRGGPGGATCEPTSAPAHAALDVATLGGAYLGASRLVTAARAGLVDVDGPAGAAALARLDAAVATDRDADHGTPF